VWRENYKILKVEDVEKLTDKNRYKYRVFIRLYDKDKNKKYNKRISFGRKTKKYFLETQSE
jgi:hypothetical protein